MPSLASYVVVQCKGTNCRIHCYWKPKNLATVGKFNLVREFNRHNLIIFVYSARKVRFSGSPRGLVLNVGLFQGSDLKNGIFTNSTGEWKVIKGAVFLKYTNLHISIRKL